jgi:predicted glycosyltransferase
LSISKQARVLVYVQHLLGVGHLQRALQLARTLAQQRFKVTLVSGGLPHAVTASVDFPVHQLPPLYTPDGSFTRLLDANGNEIDERWRERRKRQLLALFEAFAPQVLITETFPFGRRMLRFELLPLLRASRDSVSCRLVIASIRDILQPRSKPGRNLETCELLEDFYDRVLVHGDDSIARLEDSFDCTDRIRDMIHYTGYLCAQPTRSAPADDGRDEVLVSAGGSATGLEILRTAIAAKPLSAFSELRWRLLVSPAIGANDYRELQGLAADGIVVERNRPDFSELVKRARLSISQAGYNTMTDILNSDTACVVIPYAEAGELEQGLRARALQQRGRVVALAQRDLSAATLASAMTAARENNQPLAANLDGAGNSVAKIEQWLAAGATTP